MRKNFPYEVRDAVSNDKPKKHVFASHGIAKGRVINAIFLIYNTIDILIKDALFKWPQKSFDGKT